MKIKKIAIRNYKTIKKLSVDFFNDITLIVGKNNIGKSNVLKAIEIFFKCLEEGKPGDLDYDDFVKNSTQLYLSLVFCNIDILEKNLKKSLVDESSKKRSNQERIKYFETLYRTFQLLNNKFHEFEVVLTIPRNNIEDFKFEVSNSANGKKRQKFEDVIKKRFYSDKIIQDVFKEKQQSDKDWFEYKWLKLEERNENKITLIYDGKEKEVNIEKIPELSQETIDTNVLDYIKLTQKFFYVPAYRGGKNERDEAINKLFDIIIEDLVVSKKGVTKEYDTITDAIWGTGKNTNRYNLQSVIESRLKSLTDNLKSDSISSIKDIEFKPYSNEEIRRRILKIMLGTSKIFLNDGVKTSFESKGTGIQSSFMITLMKALSNIEFEENINIILVIEEPEAFAHPQLIREIIDKISREFSKGLFQFIVTTHSPVIVNFLDSNRVQRLKIKNSSNETYNVTNITNEKFCAEDWNLINRIGDVNLSEIVFADLVIFVEGEGDKIVFEKLLRLILPDFYSKISIISLSGNNQIFKVLKLLRYYDINWLMVFDKDSFVSRGYSDRDLETENDLSTFFAQFQIGIEYQNHFKNVINNQNVAKIKISSPTTIKIGETLSKIDQIYSEEDVAELKNELFGIASKKLSEDIFPEADAKTIIRELNEKMFEKGLPFYSLISELEGMVINSTTMSITEKIYEKYFYESYLSFKTNNSNANEQEYVKALKKAFGSKTHCLEKISGSAKDRKKPHIPIEIISEYIEELEKKNDGNISQKLISVFPDLEYLTEIVSKRLRDEM